MSHKSVFIKSFVTIETLGLRLSYRFNRSSFVLEEFFSVWRSCTEWLEIESLCGYFFNRKSGISSERGFFNVNRRSRSRKKRLERE